MTSKRQPYKTYTREFEIEVLRMMRDSDRPARTKHQSLEDQTPEWVCYEAVERMAA